MTTTNRPHGTPTYGYCEDGKIVSLTGKILPFFSPIRMVTREGWDEWHYTEPGEYVVRQKKTSKREMPSSLLDGIIEEEDRLGPYWRY